MTDQAVSLHDVTLSFAGVDAVRGTSFYVPAGQIATIVGPSGCGKSSVLRLISGLQKPSSGHVALARDAMMSFVFQDAALLPWATAAQNVALPLTLDGRAQDAAVDDALAQVGLEDAASSYPSQLSGGMRMRVSIARALVRKPSLLLMDEPFAALDELRRFDLAQQVRAIAKNNGLTVIFVTHSVFEACFLSDRVLVMSSAPGTIADDIAVGGEGVRGPEFREDAAFTQACSTVSTALRAATGEAAA